MMRLLGNRSEVAKELIKNTGQNIRIFDDVHDAIESVI